MQAIAALLSTHWEDVHPKGFEGDFTLRQNTVGAIDARATMVAALRICAGRCATSARRSITLRTCALANGTAKPRNDERNIDVGSMTDALRL